MAIINIFDGGIGFESRIFQPSDKCLVLEPVPLVVDQQSQPLFKAEARDFGIFVLTADGIGHTGQFHGMEFFDCRLHEHRGFLLKN